MISASIREIGDRVFGSERSSASVSIDDGFTMLSSVRRRRVLRYLSNNDGREGVSLNDLTMALAFQENDVDHPDEIRSKERKRVYVSLYQTHLPKLDEAGIIEFDCQEGLIIATDATDRVVRVLEAGDEELDRVDVPTDPTADLIQEATA